MRSDSLLLSFIVSLIGIAAASFAISVPQNRNHRPDLFALPTVIDLGLLRQEQIIDSKFQLENRSSERLQIIRIASSCGCTIVQNNRPDLGPGEHCEIPFRYQTGESSGQILKAITVYYRRATVSDTAMLNVEVSGFIAPDFLFEPSSLRFEAGVPSAAEVAVKSERPFLKCH